MTSPDGITWTLQTPASTNQWQSVTFGNNLFVAVSSNGLNNHVMTSPDGITWTSRTPAEQNQWQSVTYGSNGFVAVAINGTNRVMTSADGINWTPRMAAAANFWRSVTYGNGLYVAVSEFGTNRIMTSPDGVNWTSILAPVSNQWVSVGFGNDLFVAVAKSGTGNRVMTSPDGINWSAGISAADNQWSSVTYGNGKFVSVGGGSSSLFGNRIMTAVASTPLPLTWQSFTAEKKGTSALLKWSTASEHNTKEFEVQHSTNTLSWTNIGTVAAAGNSSSILQYSLTHLDPIKGRTYNYYRILQRDLDNKYSYSKIASLIYDEAGADMIVYPNPAKETLTIYLAESKEVRLVNAVGATAWSGTLAAGRNNITLSHLAKGVYWVVTENYNQPNQNTSSQNPTEKLISADPLPAVSRLQTATSPIFRIFVFICSHPFSLFFLFLYKTDATQTDRLCLPRKVSVFSRFPS
jgi:hypothetical protein